MGAAIDMLRMRKAAAAATYLEVGTLGYTADGGANYTMSANEHGGVEITIPVGGVWVKNVNFLFDANSASTGNKIKPLVYRGSAASISTATLEKTGAEFVHPATIVAGGTIITTNLNSDGSATFFAAGTVILCYHTDTVQKTRSQAGTTYWIADTYADGAASPWGSGSSSAHAMCISMPYSLTGP